MKGFEERDLLTEVSVLKLNIDSCNTIHTNERFKLQLSVLT